MSENEFIREVNDEYRRDRLAQIWSRYSGVFIGLAVLVVLGVGGWRYWQHAQAQQSEAASLRFEEALRRAKDGTPEDAETAFAGVVADAPFGYRLLARLRAAAEAGKADPAAGAKAYGTIADDSAVGQMMRASVTPTPILTSVGAFFPPRKGTSRTMDMTRAMINAKVTMTWVRFTCSDMAPNRFCTSAHHVGEAAQAALRKAQHDRTHPRRCRRQHRKDRNHLGNKGQCLFLNLRRR